mgnify:FL=1
MANEAETIDRQTDKGVSILTEKGRVWLITQNNPEKYGVDMSKDGIMALLKKEIDAGRITYIAGIREQSLTADKQGQHTPHGHILIYWPKQATGRQHYQIFPHAALQLCNAYLPSVLKYILKDPTGEWYKHHPEKLGEKLPEAEAGFWTWGELPTGKRSADDETKKSTTNADIIAAISAGKGDAVIHMEHPQTVYHSAHIRQARFAIMSRRYRSYVRDMTVLYIEANLPLKQLHTLYAHTEDTYVVSDYTRPWDGYCAENTLVLVNYTGQFPWYDFCRYLCGAYCTLPARYSDAVACYTNVLIISPLSVEDLCSVNKNYDAANLDTYLTHRRVYTCLDDPGSDYIRNPTTGAWQRVYLLPPHIDKGDVENDT